jgi:hypothetical protein
VLNDAFTTTYDSLGSVALISASHGSSGSATRSNIVASTALSVSSLETLIVQGQNHTNYRGLNDPIVFTKLITVPSLRRTAVKILQSELESGTTDNDINTQRGMMRLLIEPMAGDSTTHWFLQGDEHGLESLHGMTPEEESFVEDSTKSVVHTIEAHFTVGIEHWEGFAGSQGA